jgi:tRNA(Ile)-lysidine synthase
MSACKVMVDSATPKPTLADFPSLDGLDQALSQEIIAAGVNPAPPLFVVALSGGADSTALLIACALRWPQQVGAVHINHGLQQAATQFEEHCVNLCRAFNVPLVVHCVNAHAQPGESPEDAARIARYQGIVRALESHWQGSVKHVVLAQHSDDQVETLLLALSRGAGLPGLASMPAHFERYGVEFHRPWLHVSANELRQTLDRLGQFWVDDPSNSDVRFTRNRIRHQVVPVLSQAFPQFRQTFIRSVSHAAQAQILLEELALIDLENVGHPPRIKDLQRLSVHRQTNALRFWLAEQNIQASAAQMQALLVQIKACTTRGHQIDLKIGKGFVRRDGAVLRCYNI